MSWSSQWLEQWLHTEGVISSHREFWGRNWQQIIVSRGFCQKVGGGGVGCGVRGLGLGGEGWGAWLLYGMDKAQRGFGGTCGHGCFSFYRVGRQRWATLWRYSSEVGCWWVPHCAAILYTRSHKCFIHSCFEGLKWHWHCDFSAASVELPLLVMCDTWTYHLRLIDMVTQRYLTSSTTSSVCPCST